MIGRGVVVAPDLSIRIAQHLAAVGGGVDRAQDVVAGVLEEFGCHGVH